MRKFNKTRTDIIMLFLERLCRALGKDIFYVRGYIGHLPPLTSPLVQSADRDKVVMTQTTADMPIMSKLSPANKISRCCSRHTQ